MSQELVSVTFKGSASPYHKGDVAGFDEETAKKLVASGVADYTKKAKTADKGGDGKSDEDKK